RSHLAQVAEVRLRAGRSWHDMTCERVEQHQERDLFSCSLELLDELESHDSSDGVAADGVRALGLRREHAGQVKRRHFFDRAQRRASVDASGLNAVKGLIGAEAGRDVAEVEYVATGAVNAEER